MMDWDAAKPLLEAKLDPKHVIKPSGNFGPKGDYIPGWHAIAEANRIFGHGGWSYTIELRQDDLREGKTSKGEPQWQAAYTCICTVRVGDVVRQDVGFGSGFAKGIGDAIEGATKESATDALKRCLRTFGHPFGLALYDKSRENVGRAEPPPRQDAPPAAAARDPAKIAANLISKVEGARTRDAFDAVLALPKFDEAWAWLAANARTEDARVKQAVEAVRSRFDPGDPVDMPPAFNEDGHYDAPQGAY